VGAKILFVDDEKDITEFLCYNFNRKGYEAQKANSGNQAINIVNGWKPDIMVLDILMPEMDGITLCQTFKQKEELKDIPIIFLSAVSDDYKVLNAMKSGAEHFLSKPIRVELLMGIVDKILGVKNQA
jgi:two-component system alkaline phosphatase synthesis response regulator PhoP